MKGCYEFFILQEITKVAEGKIPSSRLFTEIHPEAEGIIDDVLQKHNRNSWEFFGNLDVSFTAYSIKPGSYSVAEQGVPSVSVLLVNKKKILENAATQSKLFSAAWEQLANQSEEQHWICIADSPSEEWLRQASQNDDQLFMKIIGY